MKKLVIIGFSLVAIAALGAFFFRSQLAPKPPFEGDMTELNRYGVDLFRAVFAQEKSNCFVSHLPYFSAISATYSMTDSEGKKAINDRMGFDVSSKQIEGNASRLLDDLLHGRKGIKGKSRNFFFIDSERQVDVDALSGFLFGETDIVKLDFSDPDSSNEMNELICDSVDIPIESFALPEELSPDLGMMIVNAMRFSGKWSESFEEEPIEAHFNLLNDELIELEMLEKKGDFEYLLDIDCRAVFLPIGLGDFGYLLILPDESKDIFSFVSSLELTHIQDIICNLSLETESLQLPEFTIDSASTLTFDRVIDPTNSHPPFQINLLGIMIDPSNSPLSPSFVTQNSFAEFSREGMGIFTITITDICGACNEGRESWPLVFDRPFVVSLIHRKTGAIVGIGAVVDPR